MPLEKVKPLPRSDARKDKLSDDVTRYVRELIISGRVRPGEFLRAERIAEAMNISSTPVREGLLRLSGEGFVELVPRRGFVVAEFGSQDIRDLFWAQATIAAELASRAARNITDVQLEVLRQITDSQNAAIRSGSDQDLIVSLGHRFHREVNVSANSRRLALLLQSVVSQLGERFYSEIDGHREDTVRDHPKIYAALAGRDADAAAAAMFDHIMVGADDLIASLERRASA